jgi:hypothetical protein
MSEYSPQALESLEPTKEFFIGIDSDGCVFDTMELKQKECFCPQIVKHFGLQGICKYVRECVEFVNLYSKWRGANRFPALVNAFDFLRKRPEVQARGAVVPQLDSLRAWIARESKLGNPALEAAVRETGDAELKQVLDWSVAVNAAIKDMVYGVPPFPGVVEMLAKGGERADLMVVSQTPCEALEREWAEHGLEKTVRIIAGQEYGTKSERCAGRPQGCGRQRRAFLPHQTGDGG